MSDASMLMQAATDLARLTGDVALEHFRSPLDVQRKTDGSPVTIADRAAENAARDWLAKHFSSDGIVGEEYGEANAGARRRWIIDPIDGTRTFVRGVPLWGTLIAVARGEDILAGAAYFPVLGEMLSAAPGEGCWLNGARSRVSAVERLADAAVLTTNEWFTGTPHRLDAWRRLASEAGMARSWGDCYGYLLVATGRAEVMVDGRLSAWDAAAIMPAVVEAGGVFTDWEGNATAFGGSAIATNALVARQTRAILAGRNDE